MQFLTALFGGAENTILTAAFSLGIVLVLILIAMWGIKFFFKASANMSRGRNRRLTVVDTVQIDPRRQMVIVRRDNVEHVIMTGGPQDVVIESGIAVERQTIRRPAPAAQPEEARPANARPVAALPTPRGAMDRLREASRPVGRKSPSLRNTSLLRSVARPDPGVIPINGHNSGAPPADSATTSPTNETNGQAKLGAASTRYLSDTFKAEGK